MGVLPPVATDELSPLYRTLVEGLEQGVVVLDGEGRVLGANPSAERLLGFDAAAVCGGADVPWSFVDDAGRSVAADALPCRRALATGEAVLGVALGAVRADGSLLRLEMGARPSLHGEVPVAVVTLTDVSARHDERARARARSDRSAADGASPAAATRAPALVERIFETVGRESGRLGMTRICELARELLGVDIAYTTEHDATHQHFRAVAGDPTSFGVGVETVLPLEATYCHAILSGQLPHLMADLREHPLALAMPVTQAAGVGAYISVPIRDAAGALRGTLCGASHAALPDLSDRDVSFLHVLAAVLAQHLEADDATDRRATAAGARALASAVETRDRYTADHSAEVVELATAVARAMGVSQAELRAAQQVALLHDIGKLGISDAILHKPGPLTPEERRVMETHPDLGAAIVAGVPELAHLADAIRAEHERWDGRGYPLGLAGEAIPLASRITFVCDAFHAMTSDRPYRAAMAVPDALAEIARERGAQFCPSAADGLLAVLSATAPAEAG